MNTKPKVTINAETFPILKTGHYANHAAIAPWPSCTGQAVTDFAKENMQIGPQKYNRWLMRENQLREGLTALLNAKSKDDIALLKNTTEGICTVANGINWQAGDNIVLPKGEFPSNRLPWLSLARQGVEVREVDIRANENPEQALCSFIDTRTRLLAVSAIQWTDGLRLKLETLGDACRQAGIFFFVDAIQQVGAMQIDVQACNIDFLAADGHKWLLSPEGLAVFYCRESARGQLRPSQYGWRMVDDPYQFNREQWVPSKTAIRFEAGSPNTLCQAAMHASVGLLLDIGMDEVEKRVTENSARLSQGLTDIPGVKLIREFSSERASGIVSFIPPANNPTEVHESLKKLNFSCALRGGGIRLSPHFYQAGQPVLHMLNILEHVL